MPSFRFYVFPAGWLALMATGVGVAHTLPQVDATTQLSAQIGLPPAPTAEPSFLAKGPYAETVAFVTHDRPEPEQMAQVARDFLGGHGRFAAPGNAVRR
ncbi:MAG: hypothetical protein JOY81_08595, partial [Alphaproteobacteria bacterium]|nr:hypothetical protein [Alphaproteobacteria bacterium]